MRPSRPLAATARR